MEDIATRKKIYETIVLNPGLHFRELQRRVDMPIGVLSYHLGVLCKRGLVVEKREGKYVRYFPNTTMTVEERKLMSLLRNAILREILIFLLTRERTSHGEITRHVGLAPSTVSYHLNRLVKNNVLTKEIVGRVTYYSIKRPDFIAFTLIKYRKSFLDSLVDNFASLWMQHINKK